MHRRVTHHATSTIEQCKSAMLHRTVPRAIERNTCSPPLYRLEGNPKSRFQNPITPCLFAACTALLLVLTPATLAWQEAVLMQQLGGRTVEPPVPGETNRLVPIVDRDAERWLARAAEAAQRDDWKLAADTLCRVIDEYGDRTVTAIESGTDVSPVADELRAAAPRYVSATRLAQSQMMSWPPAGLQAFRVLYDAEALAIYEAAVRAHDPDRLRLIARKYPMTSVGPEALDLLANWLLDRGSAGEALEVLAQLEALPHCKVPRWSIRLREAVASAQTDQPARAAAAIEQARTDAAQMQKGGKDVSSVNDEPRARIDAVAEFIARRTTSSQFPISNPRSHLRAWPWLLGPSALAGRMQATHPAVMHDAGEPGFWHDHLPGTERIDETQALQIVTQRGRPPVWQCVSDGQALFVTSPEGIVARDLATFEVLWRSVPRIRPRDAAVTQFRISVGTIEGDNRDRLDERTTTALFHEYRGAISCTPAVNIASSGGTGVSPVNDNLVVSGLVFVVEQLGTTGERFPTRQGVVDPNDGFGSCEPNSLRAFEADTGRAVWTRGRSGPPDDELRFAHFYGPPVMNSGASGHLLAVFQMGSDLNLAVFEPSGRLARKVLLGSARPGVFPMNGVLQPTVHDGTVFVPTGAGMLVALSAFDYSLRWLAEYERAELVLRAQRNRDAVWVGRGRWAPQFDEWLSSPPLIAGGNVILAPHDSDRMLAFNRFTGEPAWTHPRGSLRYLVGADAQRVLAAGTSVACIDAASGYTIWHNEDHLPTGRPAWCGDDLLVPTAEGLVRLEIATGKRRDKLLPTNSAMGNLLALDGALYSVTPTSISKFPDVQQSRQMADRALERDPDDLRAVLRLAWLAAIERQWNDALAYLDRSEKLLAAQPDAETGSRIARQRVEVLLGLAAESPLDARRGLLEKATQYAQRSDDVIRASLALAELYAEQGQVVDSVHLMLELLRERGDEPTAVEGQLLARASVLIRERLTGLWNRSSVEQRRAILDDVSEQLDRAGTDADFHEMLRLSDGLVTGSMIDAQSGDARDPQLQEIAARLDVRLGRWCMEGGDPESAVFHWERAVRRSAASEAGREALGLLAQVYTAADGRWPSAPAEAVRVLAALRKHPPGEKLPGSLSTGAAADAETCEQFVERMTALLPPGSTQQTSTLPWILDGARKLELVSQEEIPSSMQLRDTVSFYDPAERPDRFGGVLPILKLSQVIGVRARSPKMELAAWTNDLGQVVEDQEAVLREWGTLDARPAAICGRLAVLASGGRITSIGLLSGRMMWPSTFVDSDGGALPDPPVVHSEDMIIIATHANTLMALPARQGARPVWRRQFAGRPLGKLAVVRGQVVAIDAAAEVLTVLDPYSGRVRRQYSLLVPDAQSQKETRVQEALKEILRVARSAVDSGEEEEIPQVTDVHLAIVGGSVCRSGFSRVIGRDIETGRPLWELPISGLISGILPLNDRYAGICHGRNRITVVNAESGAVIKEIHAKGLQIPPRDAVVDPPPTSTPSAGERLVLFTQTNGEPSNFVLVCFPLKEGESGWRHDLGPLATISRRMLRASPDYVAAVSYEFRADNRVMQGRPWWIRGAPNITASRLFVFDKSGRRRLIESPYLFENKRPDDRAFSGLLTDVVIFDDRIIAIGPDGYYVLQAAEDASATGFSPRPERTARLSGD